MEDIIILLKNYIQQHPRRYISYITKNLLNEELFSILQKYNFTLNELCYRLKYSISLDKVFKCKYCNKIIKYTEKHKYKTYCNRKCLAKHVQNLQSTKNKIKETCLKHWGVSTNLKSQDTKDKIKQTCLAKFNKEHYVQTDDFKQKSKLTCISKYGVSSYTQTQSCKDRIKKTCLKNYGETTFLKTNKCKNIMQQHSLKQYGTKYYSQSKEFQEKVYNTKKKNNTFTKSSQEEKIYQLLLTKFNKDDITRQYRSKAYPFNCDFYIKSLDLYIEYNGHWSHGKEIFDPNNPQHIAILNTWKQRSMKSNFKDIKKQSYIDAINIWTIKDPLKYKTAKSNNLNYKIFWNIKEAEDWVNDHWKM